MLPTCCFFATNISVIMVVDLQWQRTMIVDPAKKSLSIAVCPSGIEFLPSALVQVHFAASTEGPRISWAYACASIITETKGSVCIGMRKLGE
jgi:hypothetical protein